MPRKPWTCSGVRLRHVRGGYQALAVAVVLQALQEWGRLRHNGHDGPPWPLAGERGELQEFFASEWCRALCDWGGLDYFRLRALTIDAPPEAPEAAPPKPTAPRKNTIAWRVLEALQRGPVRAPRLARDLGCDTSTVNDLLIRLLQEGKVKREGSRWTGYTYYLTPEGEASTTPAER
jgi:predicted transcriptional regulator